ncbi:MAG: hypothetical protein OYH76_16090 [Defluviicoccus sp.]|nr:hypothetical protein [Defluviicoccus sp.]MDE0277416.1 hypothetical protein [Defluviicoccus sp.]
MSRIEFRRRTPEESAIYEDDELVGEVYRQESALEEEPHYYVVHLSEDPRGPKRIFERGAIRDTAQWMVDSHPLW